MVGKQWILYVWILIREALFNEKEGMKSNPSSIQRDFRLCFGVCCERARTRVLIKQGD
jgi:hypothetical protein